MLAHVQAHTCAGMPAFTHTCMDTHTHTHTHACMNARVHTHVHTYMHKYTEDNGLNMYIYISQIIDLISMLLLCVVQRSNSRRTSTEEYLALKEGEEAHWEVVERILFIYAKLNPGLSYVQVSQHGTGLYCGVGHRVTAKNLINIARGRQMFQSFLFEAVRVCVIILYLRLIQRQI